MFPPKSPLDDGSQFIPKFPLELPILVAPSTSSVPVMSELPPTVRFPVVEVFPVIESPLVKVIPPIL